jgi:NAD(P)-dependent dehydrogenase (short-subunit alcohol dehydrogenase family)
VIREPVKCVFVISPKDWDWVMGVNFFGVQYGLSVWLDTLLSQPKPVRVAATASSMGLTVAGPPGATSSYGVSKHAVIALMESLNNELAMKGPCVLVLCVRVHPHRYTCEAQVRGKHIGAMR